MNSAISPFMAARPGIPRSHRSGLGRKRGGHGSAGNDSVIASMLGIIGVTGVVTRFRSFESRSKTASDTQPARTSIHGRAGERNCRFRQTTKARAKSYPLVTNQYAGSSVYWKLEARLTEHGSPATYHHRQAAGNGTHISGIDSRMPYTTSQSSPPPTHYCVWRERRYHDEIPNIGTILELLGALAPKGVIERDAGILKLSSRVG